MVVPKRFLKLHRQVLFSILFFCANFYLVSASVKSYKKDVDGVTFILDKGIMKVKICKDDIAEVKYTFMNSFPEKNSLVVNNTWNDQTAFTVSEKENNVIISTKRLKIKINNATNAITYTDLN